MWKRDSFFLSCDGTGFGPTSTYFNQIRPTKWWSGFATLTENRTHLLAVSILRVALSGQDQLTVLQKVLKHRPGQRKYLHMCTCATTVLIYARKVFSTFISRVCGPMPTHFSNILYVQKSFTNKCWQPCNHRRKQISSILYVYKVLSSPFICNGYSKYFLGLQWFCLTLLIKKPMGTGPRGHWSGKSPFVIIHLITW